MGFKSVYTGYFTKPWNTVHLIRFQKQVRWNFLKNNQQTKSKKLENSKWWNQCLEPRIQRERISEKKTVLCATFRLHPKTEKCCLRRHFKAGRHQGTSESKVSFTSCLVRYLHLIDFWRQRRCILRCLWYPTILCVPFRDCWAKKIKMASESCFWWLVCV